jgi:tetratricopeptide (TPR) repeat protein
MLPHELDYLLGIQAFEDPERLNILERMRHNNEPLYAEETFDENIDKRKYSHLKNWIVQRLASIDVDHEYEWLSNTDHDMMTGNLSEETELAIVKRIEKPKGPIFHFIKWYDMLRNYRQHLLRRMQYSAYHQVMEYLQARERKYQEAQQRIEQMHLALVDITRYYSTGSGYPNRWEDWLNNIFYDELLDGYSRHQALILLSILYVSIRDYEKLTQLLDYQEDNLIKGNMYSRRILVNYYANRLIICNRLNELKEAERFGYLSLRGNYPGNLQYRSNLAAVLLRMGKAEEALALIKAAFPQMKASSEAHDKINFVVMYLRTLSALGEFKQAERYADAFLKKYANMLFEQGWHSFFHTVFRILFQQENYRKVLRLIRKYKLAQLEKEQMGEGKLIPVMDWYQAVSQFIEQKITEPTLLKKLQDSLQSNTHLALKKSYEQLEREMGNHIPLTLKSLLSMLDEQRIIN